MSIHGFVLGVALLALVGWCMVEESFKQTQARYKLAELAKREDELKKRLGVLRAKEEEMRSPVRLAALIREQKLDLISLGTVKPARADEMAERRPGEIFDELTGEGAAPDVDVASVGQW